MQENLSVYSLRIFFVKGHVSMSRSELILENEILAKITTACSLTSLTLIPASEIYDTVLVNRQ